SEGGAIYSFEALNATNTVFKNNTAAASGAIAIQMGDGNFDNCTFLSNKAV
ncbi:hypothetical protein SARC_17232, partial [Sphaeroforma arctica JP610]